MENPNLKWMMPGGILGNLYIGISHLINLVVSNMNGVSTILGMIGWNDPDFGGWNHQRRISQGTMMILPWTRWDLMLLVWLGILQPKHQIVGCK